MSLEDQIHRLTMENKHLWEKLAALSEHVEEQRVWAAKRVAELQQEVDDIKKKDTPPPWAFGSEEKDPKKMYRLI